jgi:tripartite-type tricarboxylate transporter receptor subunit TctC
LAGGVNSVNLSSQDVREIGSIIGNPPALTDVLGGQVDLMFISLVTGTAQVRAGNLRAYGVTSAARQPSFPDLPAIGEIVTGFESEAWFGVFGPVKLPDEIVEKLNRAVVDALKDTWMRKQLLHEGANPAALTPAEIRSVCAPGHRTVVRSSGAKPD